MAVPRPLPRRAGRPTADLAAEFRARDAPLPPDAVAAAEQNLRALDAAVAATRRALAADPDNVHLEQLLAQAARQRADYVRTTLALGL